MSHRGGGRRSGSQRDQQQPSISRGGRGGGRGRGRAGGRGPPGGYNPVPPPASSSPQAPPLASDFPSMTAANPPPSTRPASSAAPPPPPTAASASASSSEVPAAAQETTAASSSASAARLSKEMQEKLTFGDPKQGGPPASSHSITHASRPGFGTIGRKCIVKANHFIVEVADKDLCHYDVTITPEVTSKKINRDVMSQLVRLYKESHLGKRSPAYDGRKSLYTAGPLPFESKEFIVKLVEKDDRAGSSGSFKKEREFKVAIKFASRPDIHHLRQFLSGRQRDAPQETIQVLDIVLRATASENYVAVGRSFFSPKLGQKGELADGIEYWRGYYQSLRPTQMGLSFNIDVSARAFFEPIVVTDFVQKYFNFRDLSRPLSDQDRVKVKKALKGIKVELSHREYSKSYKVTGISSQPASQLMFTLDDKKTKMSVVQYFFERYGIRLNYPFLPALQAGSDAKPVYLPLELCRIVEGQRYSKKLNDRQVTALLRATCQRPHDRENNIKQMVRRNDYNRDGLVKNEFGINVYEELALVDARVLPPPMLKYHDSGREARVDPHLGQWNMINKKMVNGGTVEFWTCLNFSSRLNQDVPSTFCARLIDMCISKGMVFNKNPLLPTVTARPNDIERALRDVHRQCAARLVNQKGKQLQLLIVILPDVTGSYGKIKRICETELGIVSQCCQPRQVQKMNIQYFENVALKINVKVGGRNTVLNDAIQRRIPCLTDVPTIIIGADVTHPQPGEDSSPSIAAVVASMDWPEVTKYRGIVSAQTHREEIIQDLYKTETDPQKGLVHGGMIRELFIAFRRATGFKPSRIIFYRDGVSEGQFNQVLLHEMDAIRKACQSLQEEYLPPVTFVVVQKRHHTRLFPADHNNRSLTDRSGNILPGTIVDTKICHPTEFDFYLNSHAGIQGTSRPTHYHVLYDENHFTADAMQMLTNNLCYTYARCTRSVSIVPPAYYAHLAAFRARYYIEGETSDGSSTTGAAKRSTGKAVEIKPLPVIKENVKDVMFYC